MFIFYFLPPAQRFEAGNKREFCKAVTKGSFQGFAVKMLFNLLLQNASPLVLLEQRNFYYYLNKPQMFRQFVKQLKQRHQ